ncbi:MAG: ribosomal protein S18-alanine N-acetyltransferase [Dehalococcoidia bacterium]
MTVQDISQAVEIEREAFPTSWPSTPFKRDLANRGAHYLVAWSPRAEASPAQGTVPSQRGPEDTTPLNAAAPSLLRRLVGGINRLWPSALANRPVDHQVLGFVGVWFMADEAHITSIAVREAWRGRGVGEGLLLGAIELALARRSRVLTLEARVSNTVAQSLYEKYGFRKVGIRRGYYTDNNEDAVLMTTDPINSLEYRRRLHQLREGYRVHHGDIIMTLS